MKKLVLSIIILSAFIINNVSSQTSIGIKAGLNMSKVANSPTYAGFKGVPEWGPNFGLLVNYGINEKFSVQPELLYTVKGGKQISKEGFMEIPDAKEGDYYSDFKTPYLEVPILGKYTFGKENFKGFVEFGPYFGYWASVKWKTKDPIEAKTQDYKIGDDHPQYNADSTITTIKDVRLDIGLVAGLGCEYKLGPGFIMLDFRFDMGLTNTAKYSDAKPDGWGNWANKTFALNLGYIYPLGKK
jgi:hypothetical protein